MATGSPFGKLVLKSSPKMSLNDRFQMLRQTAQRIRQPNQVNPRIRNNVQSLRQGSAKNRRLALQMANRPSVIAALRANNNNNNNNNINNNNNSIKQRLGVKRILSSNNNRGFIRRNANLNVATNNRNRKQLGVNRNRRQLGVNRTAGNLNANKNVGNRGRINARANRAKVQPQNIDVIVGTAQQRVGRKGFLRRAQGGVKASFGAKRGFKQRKKGNAGQQQGQGNKRFRINRNFNARNNSNQSQRKASTPLNKQQLDNELDAYMAGTKSVLDAELDAYMSQAP